MSHACNCGLPLSLARRRMLSHAPPHLAEAYQHRTIHAEHGNRCLANGSQTTNGCRFGIPGEVLIPTMLLRVKQRGTVLTTWEKHCTAVCLVTIAHWACQTQILEARVTSCTQGDDMFNFKRHCRK